MMMRCLNESCKNFRKYTTTDTAKVQSCPVCKRVMRIKLELTKDDIAIGQTVVYKTEGKITRSVIITGFHETGNTFVGKIIRTNGEVQPGCRVWGYVKQIVQTY